MNGAGWALVALLASGAVEDDAFDRTMTALQAGSRAAGIHDIRRLRRAAADLRASGAGPVQGSGDLAARWSSGASQESSPVYRDRVLGPAYRSITLVAKGVWRSQQAFLAGQRARVGVVPTRGAGFTMRIVDENHETACNASLSHSRCDWVPVYTARFSIVIRNDGTRPEEYLVVVQ